MADITIKDGVLEVGDGTPFANPFKPFKQFPISQLYQIDRIDLIELQLKSKKLTPRTSYALYIKYVLPRIYKRPGMHKIISSVKDYHCGCGIGRYCHANALRILFKKKLDEIPTKRNSKSIFDWIKGR